MNNCRAWYSCCKIFEPTAELGHSDVENDDLGVLKGSHRVGPDAPRLGAARTSRDQVSRITFDEQLTGAHRRLDHHGLIRKDRETNLVATEREIRCARHADVPRCIADHRDSQRRTSFMGSQRQWVLELTEKLYIERSSGTLIFGGR